MEDSKEGPWSCKRKLKAKMDSMQMAKLCKQSMVTTEAHRSSPPSVVGAVSESEPSPSSLELLEGESPAPLQSEGEVESFSVQFDAQAESESPSDSSEDESQSFAHEHAHRIYCEWVQRKV